MKKNKWAEHIRLKYTDRAKTLLRALSINSISGARFELVMDFVTEVFTAGYAEGSAPRGLSHHCQLCGEAITWEALHKCPAIK